MAKKIHPYVEVERREYPNGFVLVIEKRHVSGKNDYYWRLRYVHSTDEYLIEDKHKSREALFERRDKEIPYIIEWIRSVMRAESRAKMMETLSAMRK